MNSKSHHQFTSRIRLKLSPHWQKTELITPTVSKDGTKIDVNSGDFFFYQRTVTSLSIITSRTVFSTNSTSVRHPVIKKLLSNKNNMYVMR